MSEDDATNVCERCHAGVMVLAIVYREEGGPSGFTDRRYGLCGECYETEVPDVSGDDD